jgi:hypothetical protein
MGVSQGLLASLPTEILLLITSSLEYEYEVYALRDGIQREPPHHEENHQRFSIDFERLFVKYRKYSRDPELFPVVRAVMHGWPDIVSVLLDHGANINRDGIGCELLAAGIPYKPYLRFYWIVEHSRTRRRLRPLSNSPSKPC